MLLSPLPALMVVARGGIEPPTFRFSGGGAAYTNVFQPVRPGARPAFGRVGSIGLARWPHIGPMRQLNLDGKLIGFLGRSKRLGRSLSAWFRLPKVSVIADPPQGSARARAPRSRLEAGDLPRGPYDHRELRGVDRRTEHLDRRAIVQARVGAKQPRPRRLVVVGINEHPDDLVALT